MSQKRPRVLGMSCLSSQERPALLASASESAARPSWALSQTEAQHKHGFVLSAAPGCQPFPITSLLLAGSSGCPPAHAS